MGSQTHPRGDGASDVEPHVEENPKDGPACEAPPPSPIPLHLHYFDDHDDTGSHHTDTSETSSSSSSAGAEDQANFVEIGIAGESEDDGEGRREAPMEPPDA